MRSWNCSKRPMEEALAYRETSKFCKYFCESRFGGLLGGVEDESPLISSRLCIVKSIFYWRAGSSSLSSWSECCNLC